MASFKAILKGVICEFKIEDKVLYMASEATGGVLLKLGRPLELKREVLMSRNTFPAVFIEFIKAWKPEDIEKVSKMETDEEMIEDMKKDFKLDGYEILE